MKLTREQIRDELLILGFKESVKQMDVFDNDKSIRVGVGDEGYGITTHKTHSFPFPESLGELHRDLERCEVELPPFDFEKWFSKLDYDKEIFGINVFKNWIEVHDNKTIEFTYMGIFPKTLLEAEMLFDLLGIEKTTEGQPS